MKEIDAKSIISGYSGVGGWFGANYNMNIYKGCCHGCIYCDSRSECYRIENFDEVRVKKDALKIIEQELKSKRNKGLVATGAMTDHYNPFEEKLQIMRGALKLLDRYGFGVGIDTKSDLVARDIDLLQSIQKHSPVQVAFTITTADDALCKKIEQNVSMSSRRFAAIEKLSKAGIPAGILLMPILPFINDTIENITTIVRRAADSGAKYIFTYGGFGVTLRQNQRLHFYNKLDKEFIGLKQKYIARYGDAYVCGSDNNEILMQAFIAECDDHKILYKMEDIVHLIKNKYKTEQLSLF